MNDLFEWMLLLLLSLLLEISRKNIWNDLKLEHWKHLFWHVTADRVYRLTFTVKIDLLLQTVHLFVRLAQIWFMPFDRESQAWFPRL